MRKNKSYTPKPLNVNGNLIEFGSLNNLVDWSRLESKVGFSNFSMGLSEFRSYLSLLFISINYDVELDNLFSTLGKYKTDTLGKYYYDFALHTPFLEELKLDNLKKIGNHLENNDLIKYFKSNEELLVKKNPPKLSFGYTHNVINTNKFKSVI